MAGESNGRLTWAQLITLITTILVIGGSVAAAVFYPRADGMAMEQKVVNTEASFCEIKQNVKEIKEDLEDIKIELGIKSRRK